jgi:predicted nucleotidyltransferase component of viral defense system
MIGKTEIEGKAEEFGIHAANVERDYVFGWLLVGIYSVSPLKDILILKGGNGLRKAYFEHTRFSNDLDFSTPSGINESFLATELNKICDFVQTQAGVVFDKDRTKVEEKANADIERKIYQAKLYFKDFYGNPDTITISVRLDVTQFDRIYLPVQTRFLIHPYSDAEQCKVELKCLKLEEMLAAKLKCLLQRRHSADLYDFVFSVFINKDIDVQRSEVVQTFLRKTIFGPSPGVARGLLLDLPVAVFKEIWNRFLVCPKQSVIEFDAAMTYFKQGIQELFGHFPLDYRGQFAFFPSNLRTPIMEAGSSQTLVEMTYDGHTRKVEPYSLVFKRRKDGVGQEYFYGYDTTGGRTHGPGLKLFLNSKIQDLKTTSEKFEPRYPVELSKAGEMASKSYFGSPFSSADSGRARSLRRAIRVGPIYIVQCFYCHKEFKRKKRDTKLRQHKDRFGNRCYGLRGHIIRQE